MADEESIPDHGDPILTEHEGPLLALVLREQPITAYQISKIYGASPVTSYNVAKGKIYPIIRRLRERGYLSAEAVEGDARRTERLVCTPAAEEAVRRWVKMILPDQLLLEDPLRTKVQSFGVLAPEEQIEWIFAAKALLAGKMEAVEQYGASANVPYKRFVHDNAVASIRAREQWLDRMLRELLARD